MGVFIETGEIPAVPNTGKLPFYLYRFSAFTGPAITAR